MTGNILRQCIRIARSKDLPSHPSWKGKSIHYTFVVQNNKILEIGVNRPASPPRQYGYPSYAGIHSEIDAWKKARGLLIDNKSWEIVNIRLLRIGKRLADAAPCNHCYEFLIARGCKNFYFSTSSGKIAKIVTK
ncbi:MAG: hypothetical protein DRN26_00090 [Thermoplasmata archaeon]|nr:MAG: hypothetical protein DRN26_00090 [Thermoplasmata archaeon]